MISKPDLENLYLNKKMTDKGISKIFDCTEDVIRRLRIKFEIRTLNRYAEKRAFLDSFSDDHLIDIVMGNNYAGIQKKLGVSCIVWKEVLRTRGIDLKSQLRIDSYPEFTQEQIRVLIGSLLGDGGVEKCGKNSARFFEAHAPNQILYLKKKHLLLKPFSRDIYVDRSHKDHISYRFTTVSHPQFKIFLDSFYEPSLCGKLIPLEFIKSFWHDDILVTWFLDDGHFDARSGCYTISNKCPKLEQLYSFLDFLSDYYKVPFSLYTEPDLLFSIKIPLVFRDRFINMILKVATEDVLYKVPARYQETSKGRFVVIFDNGSPRINDIRAKIALQHTYEELKQEYPITKALFLRLGGVFPDYVTINHPGVKRIVGNDKRSDIRFPLDTDVIIGSILGDGNVHLYGRDTYVFSFAHSTPQISYVKLKYELLKSYVNRIRYVKNTNNSFYSYHVLLESLTVFSEYYRLFYTAEKKGKKHLQKCLFRDEIVNMITLRTFAFWLMDDGKKYGSGKYMFSLTIGKQPHYTYEAFEKFVGALNDNLGINMRAREEKISYEITTTDPSTAEKIFDKIKDHIWPYFSYKFGAEASLCGGAYKNLSWYDSWVDKGKILNIPF